MKPFVMTLLMLAPAVYADVMAPAVLPAVTTNAVPNAALPAFVQNDELIRRAWASNDPALRQLIQVQVRSPRGVLALREPQFRAILTNRLVALGRPQVPFVAAQTPTLAGRTEAGYCVQCEIAALRNRLASLEAVASSVPQYSPAPQNAFADQSLFGNQGFGGADGLNSLLASVAQLFAQGNAFNQNDYYDGGYGGFGNSYAQNYFSRPYPTSPLFMRRPSSFGLMASRPSVLPASTSSYSVAGYRPAAPAILPLR